MVVTGRTDPLRFGLEARLIPFSATHGGVMLTQHAPDGMCGFPYNFNGKEN